MPSVNLNSQDSGIDLSFSPLEPPPINIYKTDEELDRELLAAENWIDKHPIFESTTTAIKNIKILRANTKLGAARLRVEMSSMYTIWTGRLYKQKIEDEQTYGLRGNGFKVTYKNNNTKNNPKNNKLVSPPSFSPTCLL
jgi:hypothetical protein